MCSRTNQFGKRKNRRERKKRTLLYECSRAEFGSLFSGCELPKFIRAAGLRNPVHYCIILEKLVMGVGTLSPVILIWLFLRMSCVFCFFWLFFF